MVYWCQNAVQCPFREKIQKERNKNSKKAESVVERDTSSLPTSFCSLAVCCISCSSCFLRS